MRAVVFEAKPQAGGAKHELLPALPCLHLAEIPVPDLPGPDWVVVRSRVAGICGSDLGFLQNKPMPSAEPFFSVPFVPGHELFGEIEAVGPTATGFAPGQRVTVDPTLACPERGFSELCPGCAADHPSRCERFTEGRLPPGYLIGTCPQVGGGWGEYFVAPAARLHPIPDALGDAEASLVEPFSVCLRGVLEHLPAPGEDVIVLGAGTIGLLTVAALRAAQPSCRIGAVAKYPFQAELAGSLGADRVIELAGDPVEQVGQLLATRVYPLSTGGSVLAGGAARVFDSVTNTASLNQGLRMLRPGGTLVLLGLPAIPRGVDWSPMVLREIRVVGSFLYGNESFEGARRATFARAVAFLGERRADLRSIVPKQFSIDQYPEALATAAGKANHANVKVSFAFA